MTLAELAADASRLGIGYLVGTGSGDLPGAAWEMEITGEGRLLAPLLGLELDAQLLPAAQRRAVVELFTDTDPERSPDGPGTTPPFLVDISEQGRPAVYARLVGPYEIIGLETPDGERSALLHEALALLLLHREGVHPRVLSSALLAARRHRRRARGASRPAAGLAGHRPRRHPAAAHRRHRPAHPRQVRGLRPGRAALAVPRGDAGQGRRQPGRARTAADRRAGAGARPAAGRPARGPLPLAHPRDRRRAAPAARRGHQARARRVPHGEEPRGEGHRGAERRAAHRPGRRAAVARTAARHPRPGRPGAAHRAGVRPGGPQRVAGAAAAHRGAARRTAADVARRVVAAPG